MNKDYSLLSAPVRRVLSENASALPRHEAPRCSRKAEKAKAEATKAGFLPIPRSMMGSGWFHFVTTILGLGLF